MPKFVSALQLQKIPVVGLVAETSSSAPSSPVGGQLWYDSTNHLIKWYNGTAFIDPLNLANVTGGTITHTSISDWSATLAALTLDQFTAPAADLSINSHKLTNLAAPTNPNDAARLVDLQGITAGLAVIDPVVAASVSNVASISGTALTIDGVALSSTGARVLLKNQTTASQNGIYTVAAGAWSKTADILQVGTLVLVTGGGQAGTQWYCSVPSGSIAFVQFGAGGTYTAGNGLTLTGASFAVTAADGSITVSGSGVTVGLVTVAKGGTNATSAGSARTNLSSTSSPLPQMYTSAITLVAGTPLTVTHNLANLYPTYKLYEVSGGAEIQADIAVATTNTLTVTSAVNYSSSSAWITVVG